MLTLTDVMSMLDPTVTNIPMTLITIVISIPIFVIWKAHMNIKQKIGIGAFLTMNVWLIVIAVLRVVFFKQGNSIDATWGLFMLCLEPNVAILAASFSAFRSIFVAKGSKTSGKPEPASSSLRRRIFRKAHAGRRPLDDLPTVPGPTLTGLRTAFGLSKSKGNASTTDSRYFLSSTSNGLKYETIHDQQGIHVKRDWSLDSIRV